MSKRAPFLACALLLLLASGCAHHANDAPFVRVFVAYINSGDGDHAVWLTRAVE